MKNLKSAILIIMLAISCSACQQESQATGENVKGSQKMIAKENGLLLEKVIEHPELQQYFHPDVSGRVPLVIKLDKGIEVNSDIEKFGQAVVITNDTPQKGAYLEVMKLQHQDDYIEFEIKYEIEGLQINGELLKKSPQMFNNLEIIEI